MGDSKGSSGAGNAISGGTVWFLGWLFTIGYADLGFWKGLIGLVVWPYFLGETLK